MTWGVDGPRQSSTKDDVGLAFEETAHSKLQTENSSYKATQLPSSSHVPKPTTSSLLAPHGNDDRISSNHQRQTTNVSTTRPQRSNRRRACTPRWRGTLTTTTTD